MPIRTHIIAIVVIISIPLAIFLFDSRWNAEAYRCDGAKVFTLHPNFPDHTTFGEVRLEGSIIRGSATAANLPGEQAPALPQRYAAGASISQSYSGELYDPVEIAFDSAPGSDCELHLTYRLKAGLSLLNPLW